MKSCARCGFVIMPMNVPYAYAGPVCLCQHQGYSIANDNITISRAEYDRLKAIEAAAPKGEPK
jgi:hypothetical protein